MNDEIAKKIYTDVQMCGYQMKQVEEQLKQVELQLNDVAVVHDAIASIENSKTGDELLIPISNGIFLRAKIEDNSSLFVNVGSDTVVKKSVEDSKKLIEENKEHLLQFKLQLTQNMEELAQKEQKLYQELTSIQNV